MTTRKESPAGVAGSEGTDILDVVIFGATGYAGKFAAQYIVQKYGPTSTTPLKIGLAGRSLNKLGLLREELLDSIGARTASVNQSDGSRNLSNKDTMRAQLASAESHKVILIEANLRDYASLLRMTHQCYCVVSFVGPYRNFGERLVEACIETRTHYCDITGEFHWVRALQMKYGVHAAKRDVKIVHFCGLECLPLDLGTMLVQQHALTKYKVGCKQLRVRINKLKGGISMGSCLSALGILRHSTCAELEDPYFFCRADDGRLCSSVEARAQQCHCLNNCSLRLKYEEDVGFSLPHVAESLGSKVVNWSHMVLSHCEESYLPKAGTFQLSERLCTNYGFFMSFLIACLYWLLSRPVYFAVLLLLKLPPIGSVLDAWIAPLLAGLALNAGRDAGYEAQILGTTEVDEGGDSHNICCKVRIDGDPAYVMTGAMAVECGICLSRDFEACPSTAGALTPAAAMSNAIVDRLRKAKVVSFQLSQKPA